ncbi:threonine aldolase [Amylibacter kogurei]|uniref:L-threonine aldolase n=1 Tax=Paramylibacter kogurei TaxID=1889778 RepID=A0A2G5K9X6_9RHOB|nr:low specificity L-threonine aldolase [Amylibacter kogurei]PIB25813.1 threonine aldolase [Amylibacter kogurei]
MFFASDNGGPAAPQIIDAIAAANTGYASAYGNDDLMESVTQKIRTMFEAPEAKVYLVATGTAANALGLATLTQPWQTIYCHRVAHIEEDECGAPEFYTNGAKLGLVNGVDGRMDPAALESAINYTARAGVHNVQKGPLSITNTTETGTVYTLDHIRALTKIAKSAGIPVHMDGARFANALVSLGCTPAEMTWKSGIDVLSFGGTKNGCIGVEAVVLFNPDLAWEFELRRKRGGHLFSKHRYLSAQMDAYLTNDLWLKLATQANDMSAYLAQEIANIDGTSFVHPTEANMIFASWDRAGHRRAQNAGAYYYFWPSDHSLDGDDDEKLAARLVCNWATTKDDIDQLIHHIKG